MEPPVFHSLSNLPIEIRDWKICIVLPTRNEEATLTGVIEELRGAFTAKLLPLPEIIIADDSSDNTRAVAASLRIHVVNGEGKGLGYAMQKGLKAALALSPNAILSMDADGQSDPAELMDFLLPVAEGETDLVVGSRFLAEGLVEYDYPAVNRMGTHILSWILRRTTAQRLTDSHGGLRAWRPEVVRDLEIIGTHTYVQESIIDARQKGYRIKEIPSRWRKRVRGKSRVVGSIPNYVMYTLPVLIIRSGSHVRWLYRISFCLMAGSFVYFFVILAQAGFSVPRLYIRIPALICIAMLAVISIQLFTLGFLTEILRLIKLRVDRLSERRSES